MSEEPFPLSEFPNAAAKPECQNCKQLREQLAAEREGAHATACKLRNQLFEAQQAALKEGIRSGRIRAATRRRAVG